MYTSITNFNGKQQNAINHVNKRIKDTIRPLMIICYGHRSKTVFNSSVFKPSYITRSSSILFDIVLIISDEETLPDSSLLELANRQNSDDIQANFILFRMNHALLRLQHQDRFFASIFKRGILLYGHSSALNQLPNPLPAIRFTNQQEKIRLTYLFQGAQTCFKKAKKLQKLKITKPNDVLAQLREASKYFLRYLIRACWGYDTDGSIAELFDFTLNLTDEIETIFPKNTREERLLFSTLNQPTHKSNDQLPTSVLANLTHRVEILGNISQHFAQKKMSMMVLREETPTTSNANPIGETRVAN